MIEKFETWRKYTLTFRGWRRVMVLFFFGAVSALALPPVHFVPVLIPAFVGLVWLLDGSNVSVKVDYRNKFEYYFFHSTFAGGWWFGFGFFTAGLYWISFSFLVDAEKWAWMIPIAIIGLSTFFAIYTGFATAVACRLAKPGPRRVIYIILFWVVFEWARGSLFTGFPWNLLGTVWTFNDAIMQFASLFGVLGLSLVTVTASSALALLGYPNKSVNFRYTISLVPFIVLVIIWLGGSYRLFGAENKFVENVHLRLVQPNIPQNIKWKPQFREKHLKNLIELSEASVVSPIGQAPTHIIWPETSVPFVLDGNLSTLRDVSGENSSLVGIARIIPQKGALLAGSLRRTGGAKERVSLWNSLQVLDGNAKIISTFNKFHLVPFGEYTPFRRYFESFIILGKLIKARIDFVSGSGPQTIQVPGAPLVSPLICYEVIFSGAVTVPLKRGIPRPEWLLNITNDAWFGVSSGPYQHLATAQLRAVEEGLPLIRVANTGVSAVIDGYGRILKASDLNERLYLDVQLPKPLLTPAFYSKTRPFGVLLIFLGLIALSRLRSFA